MLAEYLSVFEVNPRAWRSNTYYRWKDLDLDTLFHQLQEMFNITGILVSQCQYLTCVKKAVFFSHKHNFVINLYLYISPVKIRHLDKDQSACATCLTGLLRMMYFGFSLVLAVQASSVQVPCQHCSHIVVNIAFWRRRLDLPWTHFRYWGRLPSQKKPRPFLYKFWRDLSYNIEYSRDRLHSLNEAYNIYR